MGVGGVSALRVLRVKMREHSSVKMACDRGAAAEPSLRPSRTAVWSPSWHLDCTEHRKQVDWTDPPFIPARTTSYESQKERKKDRKKERKTDRKVSSERERLQKEMVKKIEKQTMVKEMKKKTVRNVERGNEEETERLRVKKGRDREGNKNRRDNVAGGFVRRSPWMG